MQTLAVDPGQNNNTRQPIGQACTSLIPLLALSNRTDEKRPAGNKGSPAAAHRSKLTPIGQTPSMVANSEIPGSTRVLRTRKVPSTATTSTSKVTKLSTKTVGRPRQQKPTVPRRREGKGTSKPDSVDQVLEDAPQDDNPSDDDGCDDNESDSEYEDVAGLKIRNASRTALRNKRNESFSASVVVRNNFINRGTMEKGMPTVEKSDSGQGRKRKRLVPTVIIPNSTKSTPAQVLAEQGRQDESSEEEDPVTRPCVRRVSAQTRTGLNEDIEANLAQKLETSTKGLARKKAYKGFLDLPVEITWEIYLQLDSFSDALSLASVSKATQERFMAYSYSIAAKKWPGPFGLLDFQRPGYMPKWKREKIIEISENHINGIPRASFFTGIDPVSSLSRSPGVCISLQDIVQLIKEHRRIRKWIQESVQFPFKNKLKEHGSLSLKNAGKIRNSKRIEKEKFVPLSDSEVQRMVDTFYTVVDLHLNSVAFARMGPTGSITTVDITNFGPAFSLSTRRLLEAAVLIRVLFMESMLSELRSHPRKGVKIAEDPEFLRQYRSPLFNTVHIRKAITWALNFQARILTVHGLTPRRYPVNVPHLLGMYHRSELADFGKTNFQRHFFWDENQEVLNGFFRRWDAQVPTAEDIQNGRTWYPHMLPQNCTDTLPTDPNQIFCRFFPSMQFGSSLSSFNESLLKYRASYRHGYWYLSRIDEPKTLEAFYVSEDGKVSIDTTQATELHTTPGEKRNTMRSKFQHTLSSKKKPALLSLVDLDKVRTAHQVETKQKKVIAAERALRIEGYLI
ncbi:hypothetical protein BJ508DRAFT_313846 [Ascobolus immersus RN42]|uniref:Uncharacterized protein n=1 Tax=Ascobolus immersus RN42 TaxID=1160509 RepID=A0A3N4HH33_ASCIM|nr:hypothetical protein BJ508DRAFT_313846 [Ascobolus immersus RN42]